MKDKSVYYYEEVLDGGREVIFRVPLDNQPIYQSKNPLSTKLFCDSQRNPDIESYDSDFSNLFDDSETEQEHQPQPESQVSRVKPAETSSTAIRMSDKSRTKVKIEVSPEKIEPQPIVLECGNTIHPTGLSKLSSSRTIENCVQKKNMERECEVSASAENQNFLEESQLSGDSDDSVEEPFFGFPPSAGNSQADLTTTEIPMHRSFENIASKKLSSSIADVTTVIIGRHTQRRCKYKVSGLNTLHSFTLAKMNSEVMPLISSDCCEIQFPQEEPKIQVSPFEKRNMLEFLIDLYRSRGMFLELSEEMLLHSEQNKNLMNRFNHLGKQIKESIDEHCIVEKAHEQPWRRKRYCYGHTWCRL